MEPQGEKPGEADRVRVTPQLLKARSGEFALESILLLKLRGLGLADRSKSFMVHETQTLK